MSAAPNSEIEDLRHELQKYMQRAYDMEQALSRHVKVVAAIEEKVVDLQNAFRELCETEDILRVGLVAVEDERAKLPWDDTLDAFPDLNEDEIMEMREKYRDIEKRFSDMTGVWSA